MRIRRPLAVGLAGLAGLTSLTLLGTPVPPAVAAGPDDSTVELQLLAINDFHGNLEPPGGSGGLVGTGGTTVDSTGRTVPASVAAGGAAHLGQRLRDLRRAAGGPSLTVAAGDMVGASPLISALFHDEPTIEALDLLGLDVTAVGNHEFDEGVEELLRLQEGGCHPVDGCQTGSTFQGAGFPFLAANVVDRTTREPILPPYLVKRVKGVKVGFIGMTLEGTPSIVSQAGIAGVEFLDEVETANRYVAELQAQRVESIVVLLHEGGVQAPDTTGTFQNSLYDDCNNLNGPIVPIVEGFSDAVDVVVSGHTHQAYNCEGAEAVDGKLVTSAASFGRVVTDLRLTLDRVTKDVLVARADNVIVTRNAVDPRVQRLVDRYEGLAAPLADREVGRITADVTRTGPDDTALGNLVADAQLAATSSPEAGGAVAAFMNPGGVRADLVFAPSGSEAAGVVTYGEAFTVQPFANSLVTKTFTGRQVLDLLAQQSTVGRFLQPAGITYAYDPAARTVVAGSVLIAGAALDPAASYRITMNSFLADGGDGFSVFTAGTDALVGGIDLDVFTAFLEAAGGPVAPPATDRIRTP